MNRSTSGGVGQYGCFPVSEMERLQKAGKSMWFTCDGQQATDTPYLATERMLPYYCQRYGVKGFEFWGLSWWTYDPWKLGWHGFIRQSDDGKKYYWVRYPNGDGFLTYPGQPVDVDGPVSTIRLEEIREGLEDYEAMASSANWRTKRRSPAVPPPPPMARWRWRKTSSSSPTPAVRAPRKFWPSRIASPPFARP